MDLESAGMFVKVIGVFFLIAFVIDLIVTILVFLAIKRIREKRRKKEHESHLHETSYKEPQDDDINTY